MVDFITPAVIDIRANDAVASNTVGGNGQLIFNTTSNSLYVYDGVTVGGYKTELTAYVASSWSFQGSTSGYYAGGRGVSNNKYDIIDKFPFASDGNAADIGNLIVPNRNAMGQSSATHGYSSGGLPSILVATIERFAFSSDVDSSDTGYDISVARYSGVGQSSETYGYTTGGASPSFSPTSLNIIDKFPFSADSNASDVGELTTTLTGHAGQSSASYGYASGGYDGSGRVTKVEKFSFSSDSPATNVLDMTVARSGVSGQSSDSNGYTTGGFIPTSPNYLNTVDKFPFSSDANGTDVGDLTVSRSSTKGSSSTESGYAMGGSNPANDEWALFEIDKFPFSSDANATDVGDLTVKRFAGVGNQY